MRSLRLRRSIWACKLWQAGTLALLSRDSHHRLTAVIVDSQRPLKNADAFLESQIFVWRVKQSRALSSPPSQQGAQQESTPESISTKRHGHRARQACSGGSWHSVQPRACAQICKGAWARRGRGAGCGHICNGVILGPGCTVRCCSGHSPHTVSQNAIIHVTHSPNICVMFVQHWVLWGIWRFSNVPSDTGLHRVSPSGICAFCKSRSCCCIHLFAFLPLLCVRSECCPLHLLCLGKAVQLTVVGWCPEGKFDVMCANRP